MSQLRHKMLAVISVTIIATLAGCDESQKLPTPPMPLIPQLSIGGEISGLSSEGLILQVNGGSDLVITKNGKFAFPKPIKNDLGYVITVKAQPSAPINQTCTVSQGIGKLAGHPVDNVSVACITNSYAVGGTVSGLAHKGLVLQLKGENENEINENGNFIFPNVHLTDGSEFAVAIKKTPRGQICIIETEGSAPVNGTFNIVTVKCVKKWHHK